MTEKGIVVEFHQGIAKVQLEHAPGVSSKSSQQLLETECALNVFPGDRVIVRLSPPHPIKAKPWSLLIAVILFGIGILFQNILLGFLIALAAVLIPFMKMSRRTLSYQPCIISILENVDPHVRKNI
jgi:hypothetical protein